MRRLGAFRGSERYQSRYDLNRDGVIDMRDVWQLANAPTCHEDDHEDDHEDGYGH